MVMGAWMRRSLPALALLAALGACAADGTRVPSSARPAGQPVEIGSDAAGEQCRAVPVPVKGDLTLHDVYCGASEEPSGQIWSVPLVQPLPADAAAARPQLLQAAQRTDWANQLARKAACQDPAWVGEGLVLLASCQLREGAWPHLGVSTVQAGRLYQGDGVPALGDLFPQAMARLAGVAPPPSGEGITAAVGKQAVSFGRGDVKRYQSLTEQGRLGNSLENFAAAETAYRRALEVQSRVLGADSPAVGDTLMNLALEVSNQGRLEEADGLFRRADALLQRSFDRALRARLTSYRAFHALNAGDLKRALATAQEASAVRRALMQELEGDDGLNRMVLGNLTAARADLIHSMILEGSIGVKLRQADLAEAAAAEAQRLFDRTPGLPAWWQGRILALRGLARATRGDTDGAVRLLTAAVEANRHLFGGGWPTASLLLERGRVEAEGNRPVDAVASFRQAFAMLGAADQPPAQLPLDRIAPFLRAGLAVAERMPDQAPALYADLFAATQFVREGAVGQTISRASARFAADDPAVADLVRRQQDAVRARDRVRLDLAVETAKPDASRNPAREQELRTRLEGASRQAATLERDLQAAFPGYARLTRFTVAGAADLQAVLEPGEGVLLFALAADQSYGFLVTRDHIRAYAVRLGRDEAARRVQMLRAAFIPVAGRLPPFDLGQAHDLYTRLAGPVADDLRGLKRLVFIPGGALLSLPPALLVTAPAAAGDYAGAAWLARDHALAMAPSVPAFLSMRRLAGRAPAPRAFIGFAAPPFQGKADGLSLLGRECRTGAPVDPAMLRALAPLPETADELRQVGQQFGAGPDALITGAAVTKAAVRDRPLADYRVLYFATHGLLPGELRCQSEPGLALAPPASMPASTADDGLLTASDVALLRLNADLVVLSACNTAGGDGRFGGESLSGLAESFFFAGARNLLVTHWQVPSQPTVALMTRLFAGSGGGDVAASLSAAQMVLAARPATGHPFYWGAFTVVGDGILSRGQSAGPVAAAASLSQVSP